MPTPAGAEQSNGGVGGAAKQVSEHASAIARLEIELASLELKKKVTSLGIGAGLFVGAAVLALFMVGFLFATLAAGLATFLPWWLALLIVTLFLGLLVATLGLIGRSRIQKGSPPVPEQAIREAKLTGEAIRH
jgi:hypothetical protein